MLQAVLRNLVSRNATFDQPRAQLGRALGKRVQVACGYHEQRDAVDAVVVEPVANQRAALECRGLDVM
jgi:hypothetical protein